MWRTSKKNILWRQAIYLSETANDNGHPFLIYRITPGGCHDSGAEFVAKKQRDDLDVMHPSEWEGLTLNERDRLRIDLEYSDAAQMATQGTEDDVEEDEKKAVVTDDKKPVAIKRKASSEGILEDKRPVKVKCE
jgi:hypothetical protein